MWQQETGNMNITEKLTILCFENKNILFDPYLITMDFLEEIKTHTDPWVKEPLPGRSCLWKRTFRKLAFLFSETLKMFLFHLPQLDLGFVRESFNVSYL